MKSRTHYVAVIGDIVASRHLPNRAAVQRRYEKLMDRLNEALARSIRSRFTITLGDEFQGLLKDATALVDLIWIVDSFPVGSVRLGFGFGTITTAVRDVSRQMDGPAYYHARDAVEHARQKKLLGGVFRGFGTKEDLVLNGFARLLEQHRLRLTDRRKELFSLLREGLTRSEATSKLRVRASTVSKAAKLGGWEAYAEGEEGFRTALALLPKESMKR